MKIDALCRVSILNRRGQFTLVTRPNEIFVVCRFIVAFVCFAFLGIIRALRLIYARNIILTNEEDSNELDTFFYILSISMIN